MEDNLSLEGRGQHRSHSLHLHRLLRLHDCLLLPLLLHHYLEEERTSCRAESCLLDLRHSHY